MSLSIKILISPCLRPTVIQGDVDVKSFSERYLRRTIDFCSQAFNPASLEDWHKEEECNMSEHEETSEGTRAQCMANAVAAKKTLRAEDMFHIGKLVDDKINGYSIRLEKGKLGLKL